MARRLRTLALLVALAAALPLDATTGRAEIEPVILAAARHAPGDDPATLAAFLRLVENPGPSPAARVELATAYATALAQLQRDGTGTPAGWSTLARALPFLQDQPSPRLVPAIAAAASEPGFTDAALAALADLQSPAADAAITGLLAHPSRDVKLAAFAAAGRRQLPAALPILAAQITDADDPDLADSALYALADFTTPDALHVLASIPAPTSPARLDALNRTRLQIARALVSADQRPAALPTLRALAAPGPDAFLRGEALRLLLDSAAPDYATTVAAMLRGDDPAALDVALDALRAAPPTDSASLLSTLPEAVAVRALDALITARDSAALAFAATALTGPSSALALASAQALASAGDASHATALLTAVQSAPEADLRAAAAAALIRLPGGPATNLAVFQALVSPPTTSTPPPAADSGPALVRILAARGATEHKPALLTLVPAATTPRPLRTAILRSLEQFGSADDVPLLLAQLDGAAPALAGPLEQAITIQLQRARASLDADALIEARLATASPAFAASLLRLSAAIATPASLARVERATRSPDPALGPVAIRLLAGWTDPAAVPALLDLLAAPDSAPSVPRLVLLRGVTRLLDHAALTPTEKSAHLTRLRTVLQTPEEHAVATPFFPAPSA